MATVHRRPAPSGFTLIELTISAMLLSLLVYAVSTLAVTGGEAQEYARRLNRATEITHDLLDQMRTELASAVRVFGNDAEGAANLALWDLAGAPVPLASRRLPTALASGSPRPDTTGAEITGNSLFYARLAWSDRFQCTSGNQYYVDVYRWVYYYLVAEDGGPTSGRPIGLNIVRLESEPLIDALGIDRISNATDKAQVLQHLYTRTPDFAGEIHPACVMVWRRGAMPAVLGTLRMIDDSSWVLRDSPVGSRPSPWNILRSTAEVQGLLSYRHHSVATNFAPANFGIGNYGLVSSANGGFPHGFEVQITGPASARQIVLHLVVASTMRPGQWAWSDVQVSVDARDL
ncbi:MAG: type II secretion system protein [Planctomycetota bacterium]